MFSLLSLVNLLTCVPMIILGIGSLVDSRWRYGWVPMFFRVWWMRDAFCLILDYPQVARLFIDIYREMARFFALLFAITCSCIAIAQIIENCRSVDVDLYTSLYITIAGFATIGYGDKSFQSTVARIFMTFFLFTGVCLFLPLLYRLGRIAETHQFYKTYRPSKTSNHVVICGDFSDMAVEVLLRHFYAGWRRYLDTRIVILTTDDHSAEMKLLANLSWLKGRVELLVGDPTNPVDLRRCGAKKADAIFLFGNTRSSAYYNDYRLIGESMAVGLYDPGLPQHLMLRRGRTAKQIAPYAASSLEIERMTRQLLGLSMVLPGIVPFLINLLRTYEPLPSDTTASQHWIELYEYSIRNELYVIPTPDSLRGREFRVLAKEFYERDVTLIGISDNRNRVQLNPRELVANSKKLILIAKSLEVAEAAADTIARNYEVTFGEEMLVAPDPDEYFKTKYRAMHVSFGRTRTNNMEYEDLYDDRSDDKKSVDNLKSTVRKQTAEKPHSPTVSSPTFAMRQSHSFEGVFDQSTTETSSESATTEDSGQSSAHMKEMLIEVDNAFDFGNHFIVIDLASAKAKENETRYAHENTLTAVAHDIYNVLLPLRQSHPENDIVLLTNDTSFAPYFETLWTLKADTRPVHYINGCGLNTVDLMKSNLEGCAGCCILFSGDISRYGSTSAMAMLVMLSIQEIMQGPPPFPVVVELEGLANLPLFPPNAEDERLQVKAESDFVFEPNYIIGNAISRVMLYPALVGAYFSAEFIDVMDVLIKGRSPDVPAVSWMPLAACDMEMETYRDVVSFCLKVGFLPIALHRRIVDQHNPAITGYRYVITNPPRGLPVHVTTDAIFYITPWV
ncbi:calcium/potassium channel (CAKC) [Angomonas deanei]|nr:calcium/potassium channel (CAKC) [Angomonas deanei]|eukprot:EPY26636.1 calcium/potassium channel (CAKC) [Angomonas deanei]